MSVRSLRREARQSRHHTANPARLTTALALHALAGWAIAQPTITDMVSLLPGYYNLRLKALSQDGSTVLVAASDQNAQHVYRWTAATGFDEILPPQNNVYLDASGISGDGSVVVGVYFDGSGVRAYRWTPTTGIQELTIPGSFTNPGISAVSGNGQVAVGAVRQSGITYPCRWTTTASGSTFELLPGQDSVPYASSSDGTILAGYTSPYSGFTRASRWSTSGGPQDLGPFGGLEGYFSYAGDVSADGTTIVGYAQRTVTQEAAAIRWRSGTGMVYLASVPSVANACNADGSLIVGSTSVPASSSALWKAESPTIDLNLYLPTYGINLTGWKLEVCSDISGDGRTLIGTGIHNGAPTAWFIRNLPAAFTQPCAPTWEQPKIPAAPDVLWRPVMAFDSARGKTVLFGDGKTWEYDGATASWVVRTGAGGPPPSRTKLAMAYDSVRHRTLLFGGNDGETQANELYGFDGSAWSLLSSTGPTPRNDASLCFDTARGETVMFGGYGGNVVDSGVWVWNGTAWTGPFLPAVRPAPRAAAMMVYDSARGLCVLHGGYFVGTGTWTDETWEWNGATHTWTQINSTLKPPARELAVMGFDATRNTVVRYGGWVGRSYFGDQWELSGGQWTQRMIVTPIARSGAGLSCDSTRSRLVMFGGSTAGALDDSWEFDGNRWIPRGGPTPPPRRGSSIAFDAARALCMMLGGEDTPGNTYDDLWVLKDGAWGQLNPVIQPRRYHASVYDAGRQRLVVFGGLSSQGATLNDLWEFDGTTWMQRNITAPPARMRHKLVYDSARQVIVMYGGLDALGHILTDTWEYSGAGNGSWIQRSITPPTPVRMDFGLAYDSARQRTVLHGGSNEFASIYYNDTWEYDGSSWIFRTNTGPELARDVAVYSPERQRTIIFSGRNSTNSSTGNMFEYDGTMWTPITWPTIIGPAGREWSTMTYDTARQSAVAFGGLNPSGALGDTWYYNGPSDLTLISSPPSNIAYCRGAPVQLTMQVTGRGPIQYQWRRNGAPIADSPGHISGATTATLTITNAVRADAGSYDCIAVNGCGAVTSSAAAFSPCYANCDCSTSAPILNAIDFPCFLNSFAVGSPYANCDGSTSAPLLNALDFVCFLNEFASGCP